MQLGHLVWQHLDRRPEPGVSVKRTLADTAARRLYGRLAQTINRVAGLAMILFGLRVAVARPQ